MSAIVHQNADADGSDAVDAVGKELRAGTLPTQDAVQVALRPQVYFVVNEKGGVGKTTDVIFIFSKLLKMGRRPRLLEVETESRLSRFFPKLVEHIPVNLPSFREVQKNRTAIIQAWKVAHKKIVEALEAGRDVVVDLGANLLDRFLMFGEVGLDDSPLKSGKHFTFITPTSRMTDSWNGSVNAFEKLASLLPEARYFWAPMSPDFVDVVERDNENLGKALIALPGSKAVLFPTCDSLLRGAIFQAGILPSKACTMQPGELRKAVEPFDKQIKGWEPLDFALEAKAYARWVKGMEGAISIILGTEEGAQDGHMLVHPDVVAVENAPM